MVLHVATILAILLCLVLGGWQFGVYQESQDRQEVRERAAAPVAELARPGEPLGEARERRAAAEGRYLAEGQRLVPGRLHDDVLGSYVVTPLATPEGMIVPVLRGWVDDPDDPATQVPQGGVTVTGFLLPPETPDHATVRTGQVLDDDQLAFIAPEQLAESTGLAAATGLDGYLLLQDQQPRSADAPAPLDVETVAPIRDVSPWQNLSYWAQWWVFALAAVVFWTSIVRSGARTQRAGISGRAASRVPS